MEHVNVQPALDGDAGKSVVADQSAPDVRHLTRGQWAPFTGSLQVEFRGHYLVEDTVPKELKSLIRGHHSLRSVRCVSQGLNQ